VTSRQPTHRSYWQRLPSTHFPQSSSLDIRNPGPLGAGLRAAGSSGRAASLSRVGRRPARGPRPPRPAVSSQSKHGVLRATTSSGQRGRRSGRYARRRCRTEPARRSAARGPPRCGTRPGCPPAALRRASSGLDAALGVAAECGFTASPAIVTLADRMNVRRSVVIRPSSACAHGTGVSRHSCPTRAMTAAKSSMPSHRFWNRIFSFAACWLLS